MTTGPQLARPRTMTKAKHPESSPIMKTKRPKASPDLVELRARKVLGRLQRTLRALLDAVPAGTVCGPATADLQEHRAALEATEAWIRAVLKEYAT